MLSIKQRFEENAVIYCASLVILGFGAGFTVGGHFFESPKRNSATCSVDGAVNIEQGHAKRMSVLQASLVDFEKNASDWQIFSVYQEKYKESADRIRKDMTAEQASYQSAITALSKKCGES